MLIPIFFSKNKKIKYIIEVKIIEIKIDIAKFCFIFNKIGKIIKKAKEGIDNKIVPCDKLIIFS